MNKYLNFFCWIFLFFMVNGVEASVTAEVDRKTIALGESFNLIIKVTDENTNAKPNLDALQENFNVINTSEQTQIQILNNHTSSLKLWNIVLEPKEIGNVQIPAMQIGNSSTEPLKIEVTPASEFNAQGELKEIFIQTTINPESPYVSSQAIYTVQVYYRADIQGAQLTEPSAENSTFKPIGKDANYQKMVGGFGYHVLEKRYAMVTDKSGPLKIISPVLSGYIRKNDPQHRMGMHHWLNAMMEPFRVSANPLEVDVKAIPAGINFADWIPAKALTLKEEWSQETQFQLGQPVTRTIIIEATGITAEKLPEIQAKEHPHALIYPDKPALENLTNEQDLLAKRIEKIAIIPTKPGKIHVPSIEIKWWNMIKEEFEVAYLPERTIDVAAPEVAQESPFNSDLPNETVSLIASVDNLELKRPSISSNERFLWIGAICSMVLIWILTLIFWRKKKESKQVPIETRGNSKTSNDWKNQFKDAALNNHPQKAKLALIEWAKRFWNQSDIRTLGDVEKMLNDPKICELIRELDKCIYTNRENWEGKSLWEKLERHMVKNKKSIEKKPEELPTLYLNNA